MSYVTEKIRTEGSVSQAAKAQKRDNHFYLIMSIASAGAVLLGFSRTYYLKAYFGTPPLIALFHIHGAVFTTWIMFLVLQTALIENDRTSVHRLLGFGGAVLAAGMVVLGTAVAFVSASLRLALATQLPVLAWIPRLPAFSH
jgi:hypothetical protein